MSPRGPPSVKADPRPPRTEAEIATLRAQVPDEPVALADDELACSSCGVAVQVERDLPVEPLPLVPGDLRVVPREAFGLCDACRAIAVAAHRYVLLHPHLAKAQGDATAVERVESVLLALAVLGQPAESDLRLILPPGSSRWPTGCAGTPRARSPRACAVPIPGATSASASARP